MTDYSHYEKLVADHKSLNSLINNHKYGAINSIKDTDWMTPDFIDWLSPKYLEAFVYIYGQDRQSNIGSICSVIRENKLANESTKLKMADFLMPEIDHSIKNLEIFSNKINESKHKSIEYLTEFAFGISVLTITIFKSLEIDILIEKKKKYSELLLAIADRLKNASKMRDEINFNIYEKTYKALKTLNVHDDFVDKVVYHEKKLGRKAVWYVVGVIVVIILICLRFLGRMN